MPKRDATPLQGVPWSGRRLVDHPRKVGGPLGTLVDLPDSLVLMELTEEPQKLISSPFSKDDVLRDVHRFCDASGMLRAHGSLSVKSSFPTSHSVRLKHFADA